MEHSMTHCSVGSVRVRKGWGRNGGMERLAGNVVEERRKCKEDLLASHVLTMTILSGTVRDVQFLPTANLTRL